MWIQVEALEHHADFRAQPRDLARGGDADAIDHDLAAVDLLQPIDAAKQRALAGPARTANDHDLACLDAQVDIVQHVQRAEVLMDVAELDHSSNWYRGSNQRTTLVIAKQLTKYPAPRIRYSAYGANTAFFVTLTARKKSITPMA